MNYRAESQRDDSRVAGESRGALLTLGDGWARERDLAQSTRSSWDRRVGPLVFQYVTHDSSDGL